MIAPTIAPPTTCLTGLLLALALGPACSEPSQRPLPPADPSRPDSPEWTAIKARIRKTFPTVQEISTTQLAQELAAQQPGSGGTNQPGTDQPGSGGGAGSGGGPVLLDARAEAEFAVSHLKGARRFEESLLTKLQKDRPIVVYCSVGYRSAELAERLQRLGFTDVRNLAGSLFEWANEGRSLDSSKGPVHKVHPYDPEWGRLLDPSYH